MGLYAKSIKERKEEAMETPGYIKALLMPNGKRPAGRKVWSIDLETVWLPFFTATNVMGDTRIPPDAIGAPLRLAYDTDGAVKFSKAGRPIMKVAKELADNVRMVRENFTATLQGYANGVITESPDGYKAEIEQARLAGEPIIAKDRASLEQAIAKAVAEAITQAEPKAVAEAVEAEPKPKAKAKGKAKGEVIAEAEAVVEQAEPTRELVAA